jgi:hypothetical protein
MLLFLPANKLCTEKSPKTDIAPRMTHSSLPRTYDSCPVPSDLLNTFRITKNILTSNLDFKHAKMCNQQIRFLCIHYFYDFSIVSSVDRKIRSDTIVKNGIINTLLL